LMPRNARIKLAGIATADTAAFCCTATVAAPTAPGRSPESETDRGGRPLAGLVRADPYPAGRLYRTASNGAANPGG
jgi:hypothetical protein